MATVKIKSSGTKQARPASAVPWVEKYRPKSMDEVVHQEEAVKTLKNSMETGNLPHLLFYGPPGTGKTSTILALCRDLFGPELVKQRVLELNASDERGIEVVRTKIKSFAQGQVSQQIVNGRKLPPFKLIILDEVDQMTSDAQNALRRVIEIYSHVTRFALLCNYVSKIIDPITSRCAKFRFQPLPREPVKVRLEQIVTAEQLMVGQARDQTDLFLDTLIRLSEGDLRKAITYLQSAHRLYGSNMSLQALNDIAGVVPDEQIRSLFAACRSKGYQDVQREVQALGDDGYSTAQVLKQLSEHVIRAKDIDDVRRSRALLYFAEADKALVDGADEFLQLLAVTASTMRTLQL